MISFHVSFKNERLLGFHSQEHGISYGILEVSVECESWCFLFCEVIANISDHDLMTIAVLDAFGCIESRARP